jgi:predicted nuclease of predicted toxin-antitoxin system
MSILHGIKSFENLRSDALEVEFEGYAVKGMDVASAHETGMLEAFDEEQLSFAAAEERVMVTRNRNDFIILTAQFFEALKPHKGLIIIPHTIPGSEFSKLAAILAKLAKAYPQGLEPYTIEFLPRKK